MKRLIFFVRTYFLLLIGFSFSFAASASGIEAISLNDLMRDYTIVNPVNKVVYGEISEIEKETNLITDEISVKRITIRSNGDNFRFYLSGKVRDTIVQNKDIFKEGLEIAFQIQNNCYFKSVIDEDVCTIEEVFLSFNKKPHEIPNIERPQQTTVEDYFSLGVLYENLPLKITGVASNLCIDCINNYVTITTKKDSRKKIWCFVGKSFLSEDDFVRLSRIIHKLKIGDQVTCEGVFSGGLMNFCQEFDYTLCTSEIRVVNK